MTRPPVPPGQEAQVDYGYLGLWPDPVTGRRRRVWAFSMVLPYSRHLFIRPAVSMTQRAWCQAHVAALEFFGGAPRRLVPDNLKAGVCKPDLYDPKINRGYAELASFYGCLVDPARAYHPRDKATVEAHQRYIRSSFFAGRCWASLAAMTEDAARWCIEVAGQRRPRALEGRTVAEVFAAEEVSALLPLPAARFEPASWSRPRPGWSARRVPPWPASCCRSTRCSGCAKPRGAAAGPATRRRPAGGRLRPGHRGRRPVLPHRQGHPFPALAAEGRPGSGLRSGNYQRLECGEGIPLSLSRTSRRARSMPAAGLAMSRMNIRELLRSQACPADYYASLVGVGLEADGAAVA